ncbi:MAG: hypothetical protein LV471_09225 [Nitrosomonas sp.]|nr:hypothetical protein [Nitrosomonas sp.]
MENFDQNNFQHCVNRAISLIKNREAQMIEEGHEWPINTESCRWALEQAIINRSSNESMMEAAIKYVESVEYRAEQFSGLV